VASPAANERGGVQAPLRDRHLSDDEPSPRRRHHSTRRVRHCFQPTWIGDCEHQRTTGYSSVTNGQKCLLSIFRFRPSHTTARSAQPINRTLSSQRSSPLTIMPSDSALAPPPHCPTAHCLLLETADRRRLVNVTVDRSLWPVHVVLHADATVPPTSSCISPSIRSRVRGPGALHLSICSTFLKLALSC
jgi:hypothetical protein